MSSFFYPTYSIISNVTKGVLTTIELAAPHDFTDGEIVSFRVSKPYGMVELNNLQSRVISHDSLSIVVPIDSNNFTPFFNAGLFEPFLAMVIPVGSGIIPLEYVPTISLRDAFDNVPTS